MVWIVLNKFITVPVGFAVDKPRIAYYLHNNFGRTNDKAEYLR